MSRAESCTCRRTPSFMTPQGTGATAWIAAVAMMALLIPAGRPNPIGEGLIPNWLLLSPMRTGGWFYLLLCPLVALVPGFATASIHWAANRLAPHWFHQVIGVVFQIAGIGLGVIWALAICRDDP